MFCNKCGAEVKEGSRFCKVCGNEIKNVTSEKNIQEANSDSVVLDDARENHETASVIEDNRKPDSVESVKYDNKRDVVSVNSKLVKDKQFDTKKLVYILLVVVIILVAVIVILVLGKGKEKTSPQGDVVVVTPEVPTPAPEPPTPTPEITPKPGSMMSIMSIAAQAYHDDIAMGGFKGDDKAALIDVNGDDIPELVLQDRDWPNMCNIYTWSDLNSNSTSERTFSKASFVEGKNIIRSEFRGDNRYDIVFWIIQNGEWKKIAEENDIMDGEEHYYFLQNCEASEEEYSSYVSEIFDANQAMNISAIKWMTVAEMQIKLESY